MATPQTEAIKAIEHAMEMLEKGADDNQLGRKMVHAALAYAVEQVWAIQEVKRRRRPKSTSAP